MTAISSSRTATRPTPAERINQQIQQQNLGADQLATEGRGVEGEMAAKQSQQQLSRQAPSAARQAGARAAAVANGRGKAAQLGVEGPSGGSFPGPKLGIDDFRRPAIDGIAEDAA